MPRVLVLHDGSGLRPDTLAALAEYGSVVMARAERVGKLNPTQYTHIYLSGLELVPECVAGLRTFDSGEELLGTLAREKTAVEAVLQSGLTIDRLRDALLESMQGDGCSKAEIARVLGRATCTVSRARRRLRTIQNAIHNER